MEGQQYEFGFLGLGVMGRNLLLNMAGKGIPVAGIDLDPAKIQALEIEKSSGMTVKGTMDTKTFVGLLQKPRAILMLVPSGKPVDSAINSLSPFLENGDILIDGGNSFFGDTEKRIKELTGKGIHFFGMGISGGEEGARHGPSLMPGGDRKAYDRLKKVFELVAAKAEGSPCVDFMGNGAAGHFVKMVHNGIEYGLMQLIAETYDLIKNGMSLPDEQVQRVFEGWNKTELGSFLVEITADILKKKDEWGDGLLLHSISDQARQKGTGKWTSQNAMDLQLAVPTIDMAVAVRDISSRLEERSKISEQFKELKTLTENAEEKPSIDELRQAFYFSMLLTYIQGFAQISTASVEYGYETRLADVARIWRGGCIIRAKCLEPFREVLQSHPGISNLLLNRQVAERLAPNYTACQKIISWGIRKQIPLLAYSATLGYFESMRNKRLPTYLVQAQRDFFGAHQYQRTDREGNFHTIWNE